MTINEPARACVADADDHDVVNRAREFRHAAVGNRVAVAHDDDGRAVGLPALGEFGGLPDALQQRGPTAPGASTLAVCCPARTRVAPRAGSGARATIRPAPSGASRSRL